MFNKSKHLNFKELHDRADNLIGQWPPVKRRRSLNLSYKILKHFALAAAVLFLLWLVLLSSQIFGLKQIYSQARLGQANLEQAAAFAGRGNFKEAASLARSAENNFSLAVRRLLEIKRKTFLNYLPVAGAELNAAAGLLVSAEFLSQAVYGGADFARSLAALTAGDEKLSFSQLSRETKRGILKKIFEAAPELNGIKANLSLAEAGLEQVKAPAILFFLGDKISQLKKQISQAGFILDKAVPLSQLIPALAGYPREVNYLVMLQNNDELRPTGGFLGTYGILRAKDGDILNFNTHDIYHLDMPLENKLNLEPPAPIKKYLNRRWYLRDANWSPDWPAAAKTIERFYQTESGLNAAAEKIPEFTGVLALTPKLITDFLKITGPLKVEGQTYDQNNFQDLLQYRVEKGYELLGVPAWQRKEVIGELSQALKIKIFDLPAERWPEIINAVISNLTEKNLMLYLFDGQLENLAAENGWTGEIKNYYGDYLMVVDANLAALKTDAVMSRSISYKVSEKAGGLTAELTLNYAHNGQVDWKTSAYKSYTRIYAPQGSRLIKVSGYKREEVDSGGEAGKTWFGFYLTVDPGKIKSFVVEYELPAAVKLNNNYGLYIQKQPGKELERLSVDLSWQNIIKSYSPTSLSTQKIGPKRVKWQGNLSIDRSFNVNF